MASVDTLPPGNKSDEIFGANRDDRIRGGSDNESDVRNETDDRLPITRLQAYKLRQSWKCVRRELEQTALDALIKMLRTNSNYSSLVGLSPDKIGSGEFETMAMKLFSAVDECMTRAADIDVAGIVEQAQILASQIPFSELGLIKDYEQPVLSAIKQTLGDRYSDTMDSIYKMVVRFLVDTIHSSL